MIKTLVVAFLLVFLATNVCAETADQNDELNQVESGIDAVKQNMRRLFQQKDSLQDQLAEIEKRYGETASAFRSLHRQIEQKRQGLDAIRREIQDHQNDISRQYRALEGQIRSAYAMGRQGKLKLILNQQDPALSARMIAYYEYFNRERLNKIAAIEETVKQLDQLDQQKQAETELLERDLAQKQKDQLDLDEIRKQRSELLAKTTLELSSSEQQLSHLNISENKLKSLIRSLQGSNDEQEGDIASIEPASELMDEQAPLNEDFSKVTGDFPVLKGKLPWPVRGKLAQKFGSPRSGSIWDGVLIDAREGAEIHAVSSGKVAYADWLRAYGLLMIIDHGKGYMTLYAFNQSLYKQAGDSVEAGDVIASVGESGGRSQPGLYFGIRKKGMPIDPLEWCRK